METLIIRIFRRSHTKPEEIAGLIETVGSEEKRAFQSFSEMITAIESAVFGQDSQGKKTTERNNYTNSEKKHAG